MVHGKSDPLPSQIPHSKWKEIQEEECVNHVINSIREEIVLTAMNAVYKTSIVKKSHSFVVNCAHIAWLQLFNWMDLECETVENSPTLKNQWADDEKQRCESVPPDSWVFGNVEIRKRISPIQTNCMEPCEQIDDSHILPDNITRPALPDFPKQAIEPPVDKVIPQSKTERSLELTYAPDSEELILTDEKHEKSRCSGRDSGEAEKSSDRSEALSIFTRTIDMPGEQLPVGKWPITQNQLRSRVGGDVLHRKSRKSSKLDDVKPPRKISLHRLPEQRLGIKYVLVADQHAQSNPSEDTKKSVASRTLSRKSKAIKPKREN